VSSVYAAAILLTVLAPLVSVAGVGFLVLLADTHPSERTTSRLLGAGLVASVLGSLVVLGGYAGLVGEPVRGDVEFANWLRIGNFVIPTVFLVDGISVTISLFAAVLTALVARFSVTYLHKEAGFVRFFTLLGVFATGTQLVALAGALELFFAGWEMIGVSSAFFIGFFHERDEPVRSSVRAFATYRFSDAGLLIATVTTFELLGSARFSAFDRAAALPPAEATVIALLFLVSAMGKSAQLPFSGWLPRAMEGPTPSSALFYGAVSIHAGLFLLLRVWPVMEVSLVARTVGVLVGLATALYATAVVRVHTDAKGALAHATLAQVGLILAEICLGWTALALTHLVCHAFLRLGQYLKAPNTIHDSHRLGHGHARPPSLLARWSPALAARLYASSLHRLRLDDRIDTAFSPVLALARGIDRVDCWLRRAVTLDGRSS
jgi:NADH-quinone oxidoreductase subunit L